MDPISDPDIIAKLLQQGGGTVAPTQDQTPSQQASTMEAISDPAAIQRMIQQGTSQHDYGGRLPPIIGPTVSATPEKPWYGAIGDIGRMLTRDIPFQDRAMALAQTATGTGLPDANYEKNLQNQKFLNQSVGTNYPVASKVLGPVGAAAWTAAALAMLPEEATGAAAGGAGMGARTLYGMATGAGLGAAQGASNTQDLTNIPQATWDIAKGAIGGGTLGAAMPLASNALNAAYRGSANLVAGGADGIPRRAALPLAEAMQAIGPSEVKQNLANLGPNGMLVDTGPAMTGVGQRAALNSPEGRQIMTTAISDRSNQNAVKARIVSDVNSAFGAMGNTPQAISDALQTSKQAHDRVLSGVLDNAPKVNIQQVVDGIGQIPAPEGSALGSALNHIRTLLTTDGGQSQPGVRIPVTNPKTLDLARQDIDNMVNWAPRGEGALAGTDASTQAIVKNIRWQLSQSLKAQIPGYEGPMEALRAINTAQDAIKQGGKVLRGGQAAPFPEDFANQYGELPQGPTVPGTIPPVNPPGAPMLRTPEQQAMNVGMRGTIEKSLGTAPFALSNLKRLTQGDEGFNSQNIGTAFGEPAQQALQDIQRREGTFSGTMNDIVGNSQSAQRMAAAKGQSLAGSDANGWTPVITPSMSIPGGLSTLAKNILNWAANQYKSDPNSYYKAMANVLTTQGPQAEQYRQALENMITRRAGNETTGITVGNKAALAAALLGGHAINNQVNPPPIVRQPQ